jgi:hypothetical protein
MQSSDRLYLRPSLSRLCTSGHMLICLRDTYPKIPMAYTTVCLSVFEHREE